MNFKSNSNLAEAGAWQGAGEGGWQPTRACKTRFTIKAKVVDNTTTTTTTTMRNRREGRGRGVDGESRLEWSLELCRHRALCVRIVFIHKRQWLWQRLLAHVEAGLAVDESSWCAARDGNVTRQQLRHRRGVSISRERERERAQSRGSTGVATTLSY